MKSLALKCFVLITNMLQMPRLFATYFLYRTQVTLVQNNAQGTLATAKTEVNGNTALASVTGHGLAVLDVPKGSLVDLEKGTVTFTIPSGKQETKDAVVLTAYNAKDGSRVVEFGGKYFTATNGTAATPGSLTAFTGDTSSANLSKVGVGTADETTGGNLTTATNTGLVSNKNVHYGEKTVVKPNLGEIAISSTDPNVANNTSGNRYNIEGGTSVESSKDVVTGIIAVDKDGNKTYGLEATNIVDNKVTAQTTVTAEGIRTTGDISFVGADGKETSVKGYLEDANKAVDAKIAGFESRANQLNKRVDNVEETAYRGIAIALAAQQQIPNIGAGQTAVFGGVGHYEGESAAALGLATVFGDGRTSLSAALGVAGDGEVGGRVGVAYVFGAK